MNNPTLGQLLDAHESHHSDLQIDRFILVRAGQTPYGCFRQALRELWKRYRGLVDLNYRLRLLEIRIERLKSACGDRRKIANAKLDRYELSRIEIGKQRVGIQREFLRFYSHAAALYIQLEFDRHPLTDQRRAILDAEMWEHHVRCGLALDLIVYGRVQRNTGEMLHSLPTEIRARIIHECLSSDEAKERLHQWYVSFEPAIPPPVCIAPDQCRELLSACNSPSTLGDFEVPPIRLDQGTDGYVARD
jgi:hypothetical protein